MRPTDGACLRPVVLLSVQSALDEERRWSRPLSQSFESVAFAPDVSVSPARRDRPAGLTAFGDAVGPGVRGPVFGT
jgi:hypothetical protein